MPIELLYKKQIGKGRRKVSADEKSDLKEGEPVW